MIQVIIYSVATGRVRRVVDPTPVVPANVLGYLASVTIAPGEARLLYNKQGGGADTLLTWQATVNSHTGLDPETNQTDWCCAVDGNNVIQAWGRMDPAIDSIPELTIVKSPWGADASWTYNGSTFTAPVVVPPVKQTGQAVGS